MAFLQIFEWYFGLSWWVRVIIPLVVLGITAGLYLHDGTIWLLGLALGGVLLISCIPSKKTHDWGDW
ncbi:MAG: hypothetical protein R3B49_00315 [Phycisphaerales bacterium]